MSAIGVVGLCAWPYTVDDAFIVARYAVRVSRAQGYTFNPGYATDGVTGPAWILPGLAALQLGCDPVAVAKGFGLVCSALAALWSVREQRQRALGARSAWLTLLLTACQPSLGGSGSSGLETGAATLLVCVATSAALARPRPHFARLGATIALLAWLRPELAPLALALLTTVGVRGGMRRSASAWLIAGLGALSVCAFRKQLSGTFLPLSFYAKAGSLRDGWFYTWRAVPVLTGALGVALAVAGALLGQARDRVRGAVLLVHALSVTVAGGDWMPGFRLFVPVFPQYAQLASHGAARCFARRGHGARVFAGFSLFFACGIPLADLALRIPEWRAAGRSRDTVGAAIASRLRADATRVALVDVGYLGYASEREIVDLAGITDPEVAAMPGGHLDKRVPSAWLQARAPDTLLLHSSTPPMAAEDGRLRALTGYPVEQRIAVSGWVQREFRLVERYAYGPGYYYALLRRVQLSER